MKQLSFDWKLNAPLVLKVLKDSKILQKDGVKFVLVDGVIKRTGGRNFTCPDINSYEKALDLLRDYHSGTPHFEAVCLLEGVSYHKILTRGQELLVKLKGKYVE
jgi:hypothetical protein